MTISSEQSKVIYEGNGSTREFTVPFHYMRDADLEVVLRGADGGERTLAPGGEYVLARSESSSGGTCILSQAPASGERLAIRRDPPLLQETVYEEGVPLSAKARENALDLLTMLAQSNRERIERALLLPVASAGTAPVVPAPATGSVLAWGEDGNLVNGPGTAAIAGAAACAQSAAQAAQEADGSREGAESARLAAEAARDAAQALAGGEHNSTAGRDAEDCHPLSAINGLDAALAGKAGLSHAHVLADVADAGTAAALDAGTVAGAVPVLGEDGKLPAGVLPGGAGVVREFITSSQDWTVPSGVTEVRVWVVGGGAGGEGIYNAGSSRSEGGGGGGCAYKVVSSLAPGEVISCTIGAGSAGSSGSGNYATDGGTSSFGAHCSATGGSPYYATSAGGTGIGGDINYRGGGGGPRDDATLASGHGGRAGGPWGGTGGNQRASVGNGYAGQYGGGGGGASSNTTGTKYGGNGGAGLIVIEYNA
ncbi:glycine-rich domain-containing protein [Paucidesulfovibrio longus]|uniref:glycine-rich domain-containing protein n=1 Tax=Paucidesulfovibrio longus TaxID=889 RepID=UPI0003B69BE4|nr:hypothetical protein [Paucidesulfovibrio longus]